MTGELLSDKRKSKITFITIFLLIPISYYMFQGMVDPFVQKHMAIVDRIVYTEKIVPRAWDSIPAYYSASAITSLILGVAPGQIPWIPIFIYTYLAIFYAVFKIFSDSRIISIGIVIALLTAGTNGTGSLYLWPHGMGNAILFTIIIILNMAMKGNHGANIILAIIPLITATVFISYQGTMDIGILFSLIIVFIILQKKLVDAENSYQFEITTLSSGVIFTGIVLFGLSRFIYDTFTPMVVRLATTEQASGLSGFARFFIHWFGSGENSSGIEALLVQQPDIITYLNLMRYSVVAVSLVGVTVLALWFWLNKKNLKPTHLVALCYAFTIGIYVVARFLIGNMPVAALYFPGLLGIAALANISQNNWKKILIVLVIILAVSTLVLYGQNVDNELTNQDRTEFQYLDKVSDWYLKFGGEEPLRSDEFTRNIILQNKMEYDSSQEYNSLNSQISVISVDDTEALANGDRLSMNGIYYVVNYRMDTMSLQNWVIIGSWEPRSETIRENEYTHLIYSNHETEIYSPKKL